MLIQECHYIQSLTCEISICGGIGEENTEALNYILNHLSEIL
jgi:hypothetical protein